MVKTGILGLKLGLAMIFGPLLAPGAVVANGINFADYAEVPAKGLLRRRHPELADGRIVLFLNRLNFK